MALRIRTLNRRVCVAVVATLAVALAATAIFDGIERRAVLASGSSETPASTSTPHAAGLGSTAAVPPESGWTYIGPDGIAGPTTGLAIDRFHANRIYALSSVGAVFRSDDAGGHWAFLAQLPVGNGRLEVSVASADVLYAYTNADRDETYPPSGIYRSVDGGSTWSLMAPSTGGSLLQNLDRVRTVPAQPGLLLAASRSAGVLRSTDDGANWIQVLGFNGNPLTDCSALEIAPDVDRFYAVCAMQVVSSPLSNPMLSPISSSGLADASDELKLAVSPTDGNMLYVSATKASQGSPRLIDRIYRSTDGGVSWQTRFQRAVPGESSPPPNSDNPFNIALPGLFERDCSNPASYNYFEDYQLAVDPRNANVLWVAGAQVYRSDDGAATFGRAGTQIAHSESAIAFSVGYAAGSDQRLLTAGASGIQRTDYARDAVQTYPTWTCSQPGPGPAMVWNTVIDGYSTALVTDGGTHSNNDYVASIYSPDIYDGGVIVGDGRTPQSWSYVNTSIRGAPLLYGRETMRTVYFSAANTVHRESFFDSYWGGDMTFPSAMPEGGFQFPSLRIYGSFLTRSGYTLAQHPTSTSTIAIGSVAGAMISHDSASSFRSVGPAIPIQAVYFKRDGSLLGISRDGRIVSEANPGQGDWQQRDLNGCVIAEGASCAPERARMRYLTPDPVPGSSGIYGSGNDRGAPKVYFSPDGLTWQALDRPGQPGGLPNYFGMTSVVVDPNNPRVLYAGTPAGLFATSDRGQTWVLSNAPFANIPVSKLSIEKDGDGNVRLFAFTYGRGIWTRLLPQSTSFADVPAYHWAYSYIERLYRAGITTGCATTPRRYCPNDPVSRDQMAVFLERAVHGSAYQPPSATGYFEDVPSTYWSAAWVEQLARDGLTTGCSLSPPRFCPMSTVTRDQMAVFLMRAKHGSAYVPPAATGEFDDVPSNHWAAGWIEQLAREGVTTGCSATPKLYCPDSPVTRDQMAVLLVRSFGIP